MDEKARSPHYFVSFCGVDDKRRPEQPRGWVTWFDEDLAISYGEKIGEQNFTRTFYPRDPKAGRISKKLKAELDKTDIFLALVSLGATKSQYCADEREYFREVCKRKSFDVSERLFVLRLDKTELPSDLDGESAHLFWREVGGDIQKLGYPVPKINPEGYYEAISKLAAGMANLSFELFPHLQSKAEPARSPGLMFTRSRFSERVYVDGAPEDRDLVRETVTRLRARGFKHAANSDVHAPHPNGASRRAARSQRHPDPRVDFQQRVSESDIVVVLRENGTEEFAAKRFVDAKNMFLDAGKDRNRVMFIDVAARRLTADGCAKEVAAMLRGPQR